MAAGHAVWRLVPAVGSKVSPPRERVHLAAKRREDAQWLREHFMPWLGRRVRGISSGDNVTAKRPELIPFETGDT
ncbi:hypothetical protein [Streptosporangium sp. KLBMP 9127]|nr:hypothetical protein [Streptosporangium sp. KLBMP 9127]